MSDIVISAEGLGKRYQLGQLESGYELFSEVILDKLRRRETAPSQRQAREFWALRDVSFEVGAGDTVGILGRNGAGKSTLLKLLSRVTTPTKGRAAVKGRVGTLLEVGTGFHPELTGRENVYLNGAILGMRRREIAGSFDEIVEFAGVESFLDTPVKRYSSGMYLRLAFSVAAHLDPEILLVDEVLAVGDAAFQRKCLGKMREVSGRGRTVLFVSHNTGAVENLCERAIVLERGETAYAGPSREAIDYYMTEVVAGVTQTALADRTDRRGTGTVRLTSLHVEAGNRQRVVGPRSGETCVLAFGYETCDGQPARDLTVSVALATAIGAPVILHRTNFTGDDFAEAPAQGVVRLEIPDFPLVQGRYLVGCLLENRGEVADDPGIVGELEVEAGDFFGTGSGGMPSHSPVLVRGTWSVDDE